ncbi:MAG: MarR family transcriptional regulator [Actinobacteria bacterium]|nr:MarR family transcriptional regulator [Actinomycetota bacterium]
MNSKINKPAAADAGRAQLEAEIRGALRELSSQLSNLNQRVGSKVELRQIDLNCLDRIAREGPLSPSTLSRRSGLHPATITGVLDRLERGDWVARERNPDDRRAVLVRALRQRTGELVGLYAGMNRAVAEICRDYDPGQLRLLVEFLGRTAEAGRGASEGLGGA